MYISLSSGEVVTSWMGNDIYACGENGNGEYVDDVHISLSRIRSIDTTMFVGAEVKGRMEHRVSIARWVHI